jgi:2,7-dihydroxy-5-methyl-1-naphthoate 7-O-methyltransferase
LLSKQIFTHCSQTLCHSGGMNFEELSDLCTPWCVHVVATLRIADHIAAGTTHIDSLATASGADRDSLYRVLRHLVSRGLFEEPSRGRFALNEVARALLEQPVRLGLDLDGFGGRMAYAWGTLLSAVRTGKPAYHEVFGREFWDDLDAHPDIAAGFDALMGPAGHGVPDPEVLPNPADWKFIKTVVDVGGGTGALLAEVLRSRPNLHGTLVDLPRTVARSSEVFQAAGVADRATSVAQSFFDPLPAGRDLYILKSVLHDWPDREATAILKRCAEAARPSGRVVVFTGTGPGEDASPALLMMILVGGRERTLDEFREMAREAGLEVGVVGRQPSGRTVVECRPA